MRKLLMLAVVVVAASTAVTPSAWAAPDFPHEDYDADNWRAVTAYAPWGNRCADEISESDCEFSSPESVWTLKFPSGSYGWGAFCDASVDTAMAGDGAVEFRDLSVTQAGLTMHDVFCDHIEAQGVPWAGEMCGNTETGDFWLRQEIDIDHDHPSRDFIRGVSFAKLVGYDQVPGLIEVDAFRFGEGDLASMSAEFTHLGYDVNDYEFTHRGDVSLVTYPIVYLTGSENEPEGAPSAPCSWPELQA
jgi:hypothetical protein